MPWVTVWSEPLVKVGASLTAVTLMTNDWLALEVPALLRSATLIVALPWAFAPSSRIRRAISRQLGQFGVQGVAVDAQLAPGLMG